MEYIWIFLLNAGTYLSVGIFLSYCLYKYKFCPPQFILLFAFAVIAFLYYIVFFLSLAKPEYGHWLNIAIYVAGFVCAYIGIYQIKKIKKYIKLFTYIFLPLFVIAMLLTYYTFLLNQCIIPTNPAGKYTNASYCYLSKLPVDNTLPLIFAQNVEDSMPKALLGDWRLVDRPPIQISAGIGVLQLTHSTTQIDQSYQLLGTFLQLSWVAAIFGFLITLGLSLKKTLTVTGMMSFAGVIFINSIFVWPKLLAGSLVLCGCLLLLDTDDRYYRRSLISALVLISLGLLTHDGVAFTILGMAIVFIYLLIKIIIQGKTKKLLKSFHYKEIAIGIILSLGLLVPWLIYKDHNSTSDRLIKWQLGGVIKPNNVSTWQTLKDSYLSLTFKIWLKDKVLNLKPLFFFYSPYDMSKGFEALRLNATSMRQSLHDLSIWFEGSDFYITSFAIGLFNLGWLVAIFKYNSLTKLQKRLIATSLLTLVVWIILMFIPYSTVIHQGSYATLLTIFGLLGFWLARYKILDYLFLLQVVLFSLFWVVGAYFEYNLHPRASRLVLEVLVGVFVYAIFVFLAKYVDKFPVLKSPNTKS